MSKKLSIEWLKTYFKEQGCTLLEEKYRNCMMPMKYICSCGHTSTVRWNDFKSGVRCMKCAAWRRPATREKNGTHWSKTGVYWPEKKQVNVMCQHCCCAFSVPLHRESTAKYCSRRCKGKATAVAPVMTPARLAKMVKTKKSRGSVKGSNNPNWKGGITPINKQNTKRNKLS